MEVDLYVPMGTDLSVIKYQYPDLVEDEGSHIDDDHLQCWIGQSMEAGESEGHEWMTRDEAVEFCGFCEGAIEGAVTMLEGNGGWAQSMMRRRDFSSLVMSEEERKWREETSERYWAAHARGQEAASSSV